MGVRIKRFVRKRFLFPLILVLLFFMARNFFANVTLEELRDVVRSADGRKVLVALVLYLSNMILFTLRWRISLAALGVRPRYLSILLAVLSGLFANNTTPFGRAGGEPTRVLVLSKRDGVSVGDGFASILAERVIETWAVLLVLVSGVLIFFFSRGEVFGGLWFIGASALFLFSLTMVILWAIKNERGLTLASTVFRFPVHDTRGFYEKAYGIFRGRNALYIFLISTIVWIFEFMRVWFVIWALGVQVPVQVAVMGVMTLLFTSMVPFTPGGLGLVEFSMATVFTALGVPHPIAISAALLDRVFSYILPTLFGSVAVSYQGLRVRGK